MPPFQPKHPHAPDEVTHQAVDLPSYVRAKGVLRLALSKHPTHGFQREVHEEGSARLRFPKHHAGPVGAVMMNVAGGVAGGDRFSIDITAEKGSELTLSTPSAERIYRSAGASASFDIRLKAHEHSFLAWLPQETILFNGAKLDRTIKVDCSSSARFILCEMLVLGRRESGEAFNTGEVHDRWDIRVDGKLVMAERLAITPDILKHALSPATFGTSHALTNHAFATVVIVEPNGMERLENYRAHVASTMPFDVEAAATAYSGVVVMRLRSLKAGVLKAVVENLLAKIVGVSGINDQRLGAPSCS